MLSFTPLTQARMDGYADIANQRATPARPKRVPCRASTSSIINHHSQFVIQFVILFLISMVVSFPSFPIPPNPPRHHPVVRDTHRQSPHTSYASPACSSSPSSRSHSPSLNYNPSRYVFTSVIPIPRWKFTVVSLSHATPRPCANVSRYLTMVLGSSSICRRSSAASHSSRRNLI